MKFDTSFVLCACISIAAEDVPQQLHALEMLDLICSSRLQATTQ